MKKPGDIIIPLLVPSGSAREIGLGEVAVSRAMPRALRWSYGGGSFL